MDRWVGSWVLLLWFGCASPDTVAVYQEDVVEVCGDGRDNDGDGRTDEGCGCESPTVQIRQVTSATGEASAPRMVVAGGGLNALVYHDNSSGDFQVFLTTLNGSGLKLSGPAQISESPGVRPALAWSGAQLAVTWHDWRPRTDDLDDTRAWMARVDLAGNRLGPDALLTETSSVRSGEPRVASSGFAFGVTWLDNLILQGHFTTYDIAGRRLLEPVPVTQFGDCFCSVDLAYSGSLWGTTWENEGGSGLGGYDTSFKLLDPEGGTVAEGTMNATRNSDGPAIVWANNAFAVVWSTTVDRQRFLAFRKMDEAGAPHPEQRMVGGPASQHGEPDIVWTGSRYAVAWTSGESSDFRAYVAWLDEAGQQLFPETEISPVGGGRSVSLTWNGRELGMAYSDARDDQVYFAHITCN